MPQGERPQVTISGSAAGPPADVIGSGTDEQRPPRRGLRLAAGVALGAVLLGGLLVSERSQDEPEAETGAAPASEDLRLVETEGGFNMSWGYGGRLDISLPVHLQNDGPDITVASLALDGTALAQPAVDVDLRHGGRLPLTLRQSRGCPEGASVPRYAALRLQLSRDGDLDTRWLRLPAGAADALAAALAEQCRAVPLEQSVVVTAGEVEAHDTGVVLRVVAESLSAEPLELLSVDAATGLAVTVVPDPEGPAITLPQLLTGDPVVFRLSVDVRSCGALALSDRLDSLGVADVAYTGPEGGRAAKAVTGDFPGLREVVERTC